MYSHNTSLNENPNHSNYYNLSNSYTSKANSNQNSGLIKVMNSYNADKTNKIYNPLTQTPTLKKDESLRKLYYQHIIKYYFIYCLR